MKSCAETGQPHQIDRLNLFAIKPVNANARHVDPVALVIADQGHVVEEGEARIPVVVSRIRTDPPFMVPGSVSAMPCLDHET